MWGGLSHGRHVLLWLAVPGQEWTARSTAVMGRLSLFLTPAPCLGLYFRAARSLAYLADLLRNGRYSLPVSPNTAWIVVFPELERGCWASLYQGTLGGA